VCVGVCGCVCVCVYYVFFLPPAVGGTFRARRRPGRGLGQHGIICVVLAAAQVVAAPCGGPVSCAARFRRRVSEPRVCVRMRCVLCVVFVGAVILYMCRVPPGLRNIYTDDDGAGVTMTDRRREHFVFLFALACACAYSGCGCELCGCYLDLDHPGSHFDVVCVCVCRVCYSYSPPHSTQPHPPPATSPSPSRQQPQPSIACPFRLLPQHRTRASGPGLASNSDTG